MFTIIAPKAIGRTPSTVRIAGPMDGATPRQLRNLTNPSAMSTPTRMRDPRQSLPEQPEGVSVDENFDPIAANVLPEGSEAGQLGFFTLRIKGKMASDIDSNASIKLDKDIETKVFRVRYPNLNEEQIIAFEIKRHVPSAKEISSECISRVQYELPVGDRILTLKVSHKDVPEFKGKTVYLFRRQSRLTQLGRAEPSSLRRRSSGMLFDRRFHGFVPRDKVLLVQAGSYAADSTESRRFAGIVLESQTALRRPAPAEQQHRRAQLGGGSEVFSARDDSADVDVHSLGVVYRPTNESAHAASNAERIRRNSADVGSRLPTDSAVICAS